MEVSGQFHAPTALPPREKPLVPTAQEAGWAPEPVWTRWWREKFSAPAGTRTPAHPASSLALYHWAIPAPDDNIKTDIKYGFKCVDCELG
jgi:hypothetical protein